MGDEPCLERRTPSLLSSRMWRRPSTPSRRLTPDCHHNPHLHDAGADGCYLASMMEVCLELCKTEELARASMQELISIVFWPLLTSPACEGFGMMAERVDQ